MRNVLIFSLAYYPHVGGAEVAIKKITDRINTKEIIFHMLTLRFSGEVRTERIGNVFVHRIGNGSNFVSKFLFIPRAVIVAFSLHKKYRFDVFWVMMSYMLFPVSILRLLGLSVPYVLTLQEGDPFEHVFKRKRIAVFGKLLRYGFKHAKRVQVISTFLAEWAVRAGFGGIPDVIPNGVDISMFSSERINSLVMARKEQQKKSGNIRLVTTSRLVEKNAIDDIIRALATLPKNISFYIYGIGPDENKLRALAYDIGVEKRVNFAGYIDHGQLPERIAECDIFIRPSRSEGMGNSFIEAMAVGLPVIATQEGGISDFLFDSRLNPNENTTGWAVNKNSPDQIVKTIIEIVKNKNTIDKVTNNAKLLVKEKYNWDYIAHDMYCILNSI